MLKECSRASLLSAFLWLHADLEENPSNTGSRLVAHREIRAGSLLSEVDTVMITHNSCLNCLTDISPHAGVYTKHLSGQTGETRADARLDPHWPKMFILVSMGVADEQNQEGCCVWTVKTRKSFRRKINKEFLLQSFSGLITILIVNQLKISTVLQVSWLY